MFVSLLSDAHLGGTCSDDDARDARHGDGPTAGRSVPAPVRPLTPLRPAALGACVPPGTATDGREEDRAPDGRRRDRLGGGVDLAASVRQRQPVGMGPGARRAGPLGRPVAAGAGLDAGAGGAAQARQLLGRGAPALPAGVRAHRQLPTGPRPVPGRRADARPGRLAALPASPVHQRRGRARPGEDPRDDAGPAAVGPRPAPGPGDDVTVGRADGAGGGRPDGPVRRRTPGAATAGRRARPSSSPFRARPRSPGPNCRPGNASRRAACCCAGAYGTRRGPAGRSSRTTHLYAGCARTASAARGRAG
ncbi:hypothetical protein M2436_003986 [Streptomyces sp. HB372]|nr:hypothetical protein [Streptomyces sp. HB372]